MADALPVLTACSYGLFHAPFFTVEHGTTPACERVANPDSSFLKCLPGSLRSFQHVLAYPPNQVFIGNVDPLRMPPRPCVVLYGRPGRCQLLRGFPCLEGKASL